MQYKKSFKNVQPIIKLHAFLTEIDKMTKVIYSAFSLYFSQ